MQVPSPSAAAHTRTSTAHTQHRPHSTMQQRHWSTHRHSSPPGSLIPQPLTSGLNLHLLLSKGVFALGRKHYRTWRTSNPRYATTRSIRQRPAQRPAHPQQPRWRRRTTSPLGRHRRRRQVCLSPAGAPAAQQPFQCQHADPNPARFEAADTAVLPSARPRAVLGYDTTGDGRVDALDTNQDGRVDARVVGR